MQAVPVAFFLFLVELASGGLLVTALLDWDGEVSRGFLLLNGGCLLGVAGAAVWLRSVLPAAELLSYPASEPWLRAEVACWALFMLLSAVQLTLLKIERRGAARVAGLWAVAVGSTALAVSSVAYRPPAVPAALLLASFAAAALALGTVWSGMMLGHWYLVTPLLAPRPLLRLNAGMAAVLACQAALVAMQALTGGLSALVAGPIGWLFWLRTIVGILIPLGLAAMIWRTARVRSMMSATGLLYIALGAVLAGEIIAKALFFIAQTPV